MICSPMCTVPVTSSRRRMSSDFEVLVAWPVSWARATPGDTTQRRTSNMAFRTLAMGPPRVRRTSSRCRGLMLVQHRGSAARAAPLRLRGPRQLHPLVRQPGGTPQGLGGSQSPAKGLVDSRVRGEGLGNFRFEQREVDSCSVALVVLATDAACEGREVVLGQEIVVWFVLTYLAHKIFARSGSLPWR